MVLLEKSTIGELIDHSTPYTTLTNINPIHTEMDILPSTTRTMEMDSNAKEEQANEEEAKYDVSILLLVAVLMIISLLIIACIVLKYKAKRIKASWMIINNMKKNQQTIKSDEKVTERQIDQTEEVEIIIHVNEHETDNNRDEETVSQQTVSQDTFQDMTAKKVELDICFEEKSQNPSTDITNTPYEHDSDSMDNSIEEMYCDDMRRSTYSTMDGKISLGESNSIGSHYRNEDNYSQNFDIQVIESTEGSQATNLYS